MGGNSSRGGNIASPRVTSYHSTGTSGHKTGICGTEHARPWLDCRFVYVCWPRKRPIFGLERCPPRSRCKTIEYISPPRKFKKIKEMNPPGGCVLCGGFKGPAAALAAGALRAPVSVRGTLTKSAGRPRRRSRWEQPPRPKSDAATKAKGRPRAAFCFGGWFRSVRCCR